VLRDRRVVATVPSAEVDADDLVTMMAGEPVAHPGTAATTRGPEILRVEGLTGRRVRDVSLSLHAGEVVGVAGLAGSGRSELLRLLAGAQRPSAGRIAVRGRPLLPGSTRRALAAGVALVPEDRLHQALLPQADVTENVVLASLRELSRLGIRSARRDRAAWAAAARQLTIRATGPRQPVTQLSGGNQQKLVLARVLRRAPAVLLLDEPTRGVDIRTKQAIRGLIARTASDAAVLIVSSELDELTAVADRVLVLREGRVVAELSAADADEETVLRHCYGGSSR
jgi:ABC-type sugar transport system ATPase subunit